MATISASPSYKMMLVVIMTYAMTVQCNPIEDYNEDHLDMDDNFVGHFGRPSFEGLNLAALGEDARDSYEDRPLLAGFDLAALREDTRDSDDFVTGMNELYETENEVTDTESNEVIELESFDLPDIEYDYTVDYPGDNDNDGNTNIETE